MKNVTASLHLPQLVPNQPKSLSPLPEYYNRLLTNLCCLLPPPSLVNMPEFFYLNKGQITSLPCSKPSNIFPTYLEKNLKLYTIWPLSTLLIMLKRD